MYICIYDISNKVCIESGTPSIFSLNARNSNTLQLVQVCDIYVCFCRMKIVESIGEWDACDILLQRPQQQRAATGTGM